MDGTLNEDLQKENDDRTLKILFIQLTNSNDPSIVSETSKQIPIFITKNREEAEGIILKLAQFIDSNLSTISVKVIVKVINSILKTLNENVNLLTNLMKSFFPLLTSIISNSELFPEEYNLLTLTIGKIVNRCGSNAAQLIEFQIESIFKNDDRLVKEQKKCAWINLLSEFIKNSPVITYNKLIETFHEFFKLIKHNYKHKDENIRNSISFLVNQFLHLLNNRDYSIKETYTKNIYSIIEENIQNKDIEYMDVNVIHGIILLIRAITVRREFFNEKYKTVMEFFFNLRNSKNILIQKTIIELIPYFGDYLNEVFSKYFFNEFSVFFIQLYLSKPNPIIRNAILKSLGKLSTVMTKDIFSNIIQDIINIIEADFKKENIIVNLAEIECLSNLLVKYSNEILSKIPLNMMLNQIFKTGFYESHVKFLTELLSVFDENSSEKIQIILIVLNVVSLIIASKQFVLQDTLLKFEEAKKLGIISLDSLEDLNNTFSVSNLLLTNNSSTSFTSSFFLFGRKGSDEANDNLLNLIRKHIIDNIAQEQKAQNPISENRIITMTRNALIFLGKLNHPFFNKDILNFYQMHCIPSLDNPKSKIKIEIMSLATAPWIPHYGISKDNDVDYLITIILDSFLDFILINQNDEVKNIMLKNLDNRYDRLLVTDNFFMKIILILHSTTDSSVREQVIIIIGRLIEHNYNMVKLFLKKNVMEIFMTLESSENITEKEDSIILLSYIVKYTGKCIVEYLEIYFSNLVRLLKDDDEEVQNKSSSDSEEESNQTLNMHILSILGELIINSENHNKEKEIQYKEIITLCIKNLKENSSQLNQEISLKTILAIFEHSDYDWNIYFNFIDLVNILIQVLIRTNNRKTRIYALKIFGFIGTMAPDKLEAIWNIQKIDTENKTENYDADEYENFDDEEIVVHNREQVKKNRRKNVLKFFSNYGKFKVKNLDFERMAENKEIDPLTYHTIIALIKILKDESQQEQNNNVINILNKIIKYLQTQNEDKVLIELILTRLIEAGESFNGSTQVHIFNCILYIVQHFNSNCKNHLPELVKLIEDFIEDDDLQNTIFSILICVLENYLDVMEKYLNKLIPILISLLSDKGDKLIYRINSIRMKVFQCFNCISQKLGNYLGIIIPEMLILLDSSMMSFNPYSKKIGNVNEDKSTSSMTLQRKDLEIFAFIDRIIPLYQFAEQIPKVVESLIKFMNYCPQANELIMGLFMKMLKYCKKEFISFLPTILRIAKNNKINIIDYFDEIKRNLENKDESDLMYERNYIGKKSKKNKYKINSQIKQYNSFDLMKNYSSEFFKQHQNTTYTNRKRTLESNYGISPFDITPYNNNLSLFQNQSENLSEMVRTRVNKEEIINEFDPKNCSLEEDWHEWFKSSFNQLFFNSPSYVLSCCRHLSEYLTDLYNYAFISVWRTFSQSQKSKIFSHLNMALSSNTTPNDILLTILNLVEFIEREESHIEFVDFGNLAKIANKCKAYAKELFYTENDYRISHETDSLENLITLYYELNLPESSIGILKIAEKKKNNIKEDDWYLKLHRWNEALKIIETKQSENKNKSKDLDLIRGKILCYEGLSDWEKLLELDEELYATQQRVYSKNSCNFSLKAELDNDVIIKKTNSSTSLGKNNFSPYYAKASFNLGKWDKLNHYMLKMSPSEDEEEYEKNFFQAVFCIKEKKYEEAKIYILNARNAIDDKIKTLLTEGYERAYKLLLSNQHLYELEEIIRFYSPENKGFSISKERLKKIWDNRLEMISEETDAYERILSIRGLVFNIEEDYDKHLDLAKIARKDDLFEKCMNVLNRLKRDTVFVKDKNISISLSLSLNKCLNENDFLSDSQKAIDNLNRIITNEFDNDSENKISEKLKSKVYCYYGYLNLQQYDIFLTEKKVDEIKNYFDLSIKFDNKNYKAWHYFGLLNYKYFELLENNEKIRGNYASNAIKGFTTSVTIGGKNISKTLQDLLRLVDVWFQIGEDKSLLNLIRESFNKISIDSWLVVIPQLLARVNIKNEMIRETLVELLRKIGLNHPWAIIYPLIVMKKSKNKIRSETAGMILKDISEKYKQLVLECELIIDELNRCAMLLHEKWMEAIEESANLFFESNNIIGMVEKLKEAHERMKDKPKTVNEIHFHQKYKSQLNEAELSLNNYIETNDISLIYSSWSIYHSIYISMRDAFAEMKALDLDTVSPLLSNFNQSEICIPGIYRSEYPIIKIAGFKKDLIILNSKQRPRKIVLFGSDGKEYMFLLKGHEDLRQDERAMQLFGLINSLLSIDVDTCDKNLFIRRFPVIALSNNTGILGWVPNCDTLSSLIKEYREINDIQKDLEQRMIIWKNPRYDSSTLLSKLEIFNYTMKNTLGLDMYNILWKKSKNSEEWLDRRTNYSRSLAVMSMVGYILGLGDRHPSNLMLDRKNGKILHIDFGDCFEVAMKREKYPEKIPFRLTRMLVKALEVSGIEGTFKITCENVMRVLRYNKDSLITILTAFVHDPLISFRFLIPLILKQNKEQKIFHPSGIRRNSTLNGRISESLKEGLREEMFAINNNINKKKTSVMKPSTLIQGFPQFHKNKNNINKKESGKLIENQRSNDEIEEMKIEKRRMGSAERQLYNEFTETEQLESEELNKIAKIVLERIIDKLKGTDFSKMETLDFKQQVEKLIKQATNAENLCQSYMGWCPYW